MGASMTDVVVSEYFLSYLKFVLEERNFFIKHLRKCRNKNIKEMKITDKQKSSGLTFFYVKNIVVFNFVNCI